MDLKALLAKLNALDLGEDAAALVTQLLEAIEGGSSVTDDQLADLSAALREQIKALAEAGDDDALTLADALAEARVEIKTEQDTRAEAARVRQEKATALLDAIAAEDGDEGEGEATDEEAPAEESNEDAEDAEEAPAEEAKEKEPVAAAGKPAPAPRITKVAARRPENTLIKEPEGPKIPSLDELSFVASAAVDSIRPGSILRGAEAMSAALDEAYRNHILNVEGGQGGKVRIGQLRWHDGTALAAGGDRYLDDDEFENARKIAKLANEVRALGIEDYAEALSASGGNCFPLNTDPTIRRYGVKDRPVRDGLHVRMGAPRGGVKTIPPLSISTTAFDTATSQWTEANDESPSSPTTKPYATLVCQDTPRTTDVYAVTTRMRFGEFNRRFYPELVEAWWDQIMVVQARKAERYLLTGGIGKVVSSSGYSKAVTMGENMSATRDILAALDKASAIMRQSRRLGRSQVIQFGFPFWMYDLMRVDLARELPGATAERLATAEAEIDRWFRLRNIAPVPILDGETAAAEFAIQPNAGHLQPWPSTFTGYLTLPGEWAVLDGGTLDLGLYRDTTLVNTNDVEMFVEQFEAPHFLGLESWKVTFDVVPNGVTQAAATVSFADGS